MNKSLKFAPHLVPLVLSGQKTSTWRLFDDKNLEKGDFITLVKRPELVPFAIAQIVSVIEKPLGKLTTEDKKGHESYESDEKMFETYRNYYDRNVDKNTTVKIVHFELLEGQN